MKTNSVFSNAMMSEAELRAEIKDRRRVIERLERGTQFGRENDAQAIKHHESVIAGLEESLRISSRMVELELNPATIAKFKATGPGWQARMSDALDKAEP